jgi:hypothetical protein
MSISVAQKRMMRKHSSTDGTPNLNYSKSSSYLGDVSNDLGENFNPVMSYREMNSADTNDAYCLNEVGLRYAQKSSR